MATITPQGVAILDLGEWKTRLEGLFRDALGADLSLAPETPEGQIVGVMALTLAEMDETIADLANAFGVSNARGRQIDDNASLVHLARDGATRSRATLTLTGVAGTTVPAGARVKNDAGAVFFLDDTTLIGAANTVDATATCTETGPVEAGAGTLTSIVSLVPGWETVTNAADAAVGRDKETDRVFRSRYRASTARLANAPRDAVEAALIEEGATAWRVEENDGSAAGIVTGSAGHSNIGALRAISDGSLRVLEKDFTGIDLSSAGDMAAVAAALQAALREEFPRTVVSYETDRFRASFPDTGQLGDAFEVHTQGTGTDLSDALKLQSDDATILLNYLDLQGTVLPPHSVLCIVRGGLDAEVAAAIRRTKGLGVATFGGGTGAQRISVEVDGLTTYFRRPTETAVAVAVTVDVDSDFPAEGAAAIRRNLASYAAGTWRGGAGQFDTRGFAIGRPIDPKRLQTPVNAVQGHEIVSLEVTAGGDALPALPALDVLYTLAEADVTVTVE